MRESDDPLYLTRDDLLFGGPDLKSTVEPGMFDLRAGPSSAERLAGSCELVA